MMLSKTTLTAMGAGALLISTPMMAVAQSSTRDVAIDRHNNPITDSRGNCVRTTWQQDGDACGTAVPEKAVVQQTRTEVITPARRLTTEQRTILFDFDKDNLDSAAQRNLDTLSQVLKSSSDVRHANIVGYADPIGKDSYNQKLSERRAQAVKDYMAERGYLNTRVTELRALGASDKFAQCDEVTGRNAKIDCLRPNRRVEVELEFIE